MAYMTITPGASYVAAIRVIATSGVFPTAPTISAWAKGNAGGEIFAMVVGSGNFRG